MGFCRINALTGMCRSKTGAKGTFERPPGIHAFTVTRPGRAVAVPASAALHHAALRGRGPSRPVRPPNGRGPAIPTTKAGPADRTKPMAWPTLTKRLDGLPFLQEIWSAGSRRSFASDPDWTQGQFSKPCARLE